MRCEELTQATLDQSVDEMQLYYDALRDCPKGHVYELESYCSKKWRFGYPSDNAS
ncbi:hypothetical protein Sjap_025829 [Stephania japonica]|uniref:Uncharacterized protein n=1 Tax=Stephania japonica TaxID=461633 RepID=A0AAP0EA81_9MAGN